MSVAGFLSIVLLAQTRPTTPGAVGELDRAIEIFKSESGQLGLRAGQAAAKSTTAKKKSRWHGRLFENFRNDFLDAIPHEVVQRGGTKGMLRRNQYGLNVTGPVVLPKLYDGTRSTFFTFTFEGVKERIGRSSLRTIPTMAERRGDWSETVDQAGQPLPIYDPATTAPNEAFDSTKPVSAENPEYRRTPFPGNRIPDSRLDGTAQQYLKLYPAPNSNAGPFFRNNFFAFTPEQNRASGTIARVDHTVNEKNRVSFNINWSNGTDGAAPLFNNAANPGSVAVDRRSRRASLEHSLTKSARSVNSLAVSVATSQFEYQTLAREAFPYLQFSPYLSMGRPNPDTRSRRHTYAASDGFSTRRGSHRLAMSGQFVKEQVHVYAPQYPSGMYRFSAGLTSLPGVVNTGHGFASFLLGGAEYAERSVVVSPSYFRKPSFAMRASDQWEIRKGLTLSMAVNFEGSGPRTEKYDRQSTVSLDAINPVNGRPGAMIVAGRNGVRRAFQPWLFKPEPSASLAWSVPGAGKSIMRASYSRSYSAIPVYTSQWGTQAFNGSPTWISPNPQLTPAVTLAQGVTSGGREFPDLRPESANDTVADLVEPTGVQPTYQSAGLSFERDMGAQVMLTLGAGHAGGRNLLLSNSGANPNAISPDALAYRDDLNNEAFKRQLRPYPQYQRFDVFSSWPEGKYRRDACYMRLEKRSSSGLTLSAYYEFSKQMDNYSGPYGVQDFFHRENEWSLTSSNNPHRVSLTYVYELPFGPNRLLLTSNDWRKFIFEGWSLSGVTTMTSGEPMALHPQFNNTGGVLDVVNVNVVPGVDPHVANQTPDRWFNPEAFAQPDDFTMGNASRTHPSLRMPGNQNHDLSLNKRFALTTERSLELSMVGLNFVNRANWTDPDTLIGPASAPNVNAGRIIGSRGGRVIQLGLRYSF